MSRGQKRIHASLGIQKVRICVADTQEQTKTKRFSRVTYRLEVASEGAVLDIGEDASNVEDADGGLGSDHLALVLEGVDHHGEDVAEAVADGVGVELDNATEGPHGGRTDDDNGVLGALEDDGEDVVNEALHLLGAVEGSTKGEESTVTLAPVLLVGKGNSKTAGKIKLR